MNFSEHYFSRYPHSPVFLRQTPNKDTGIIVVIPCYDDDFIFHTLLSLEETAKTFIKIEVMVVVNSSEISSPDVVKRNRKTYETLKFQSENNFYQRFQLFPILIENTPRKIAGVGFARKAGMDEAVRRFSMINKPDGIILSLDADCLVAEDYFSTIENELGSQPNLKAFTLPFCHNFDKKLFSADEIEACKLYEIYLRYFRLALKATGFPHSFHTIGSCFGVEALSYVKAGGMSRRQGGEDFYFLHKLSSMSPVLELKSGMVFPASRVSNRVPFGTGPAVQKIIQSKEFVVYHIQLFFILKRFFDLFSTLYTHDVADGIPSEIICFIGEEKLRKTIIECKTNTRDEKSFVKRMFSKFDAFFIIKFLNSFTSESAYPPTDILEMSAVLLAFYKKTLVEKNIETMYQSIFSLDKEF